MFAFCLILASKGGCLHASCTTLEPERAQIVRARMLKVRSRAASER